VRDGWERNLMEPPQSKRNEETSGSDTGATGHNSSEVNLWRLLGRLGTEAVLIGFFVGQKWILKLLIHSTRLEDEWWARWLMSVSALFAVVGFTVIAGSELVIDCAAALRAARRAIRGEGR
jgi:hypothetical protein